MAITSSPIKRRQPFQSIQLLIKLLLISTCQGLSTSNMSSSSSANIIQKTIKEICRKPPSHWVGDGFHVYPVFANKAFTNELSPFLMFDYAAPKEFPPTTRQRGVGQHPHRGFETVTLAFQGEVEHADSKGNQDTIGPGDVQWMTAARGIVHEEFHSTKFAREGGVFEMCQLWVNLPADKKMTEPRYQPILDKDIPKVGLLSSSSSSSSDQCSEGGGEEKNEESLIDGYTRVISGEFRNVKGPAMTYTPVNMWDVIITNQEKEFEFDITEGHTTLVFVRRGSVEVMGKKLNTADVAIMSLDGSKVLLQAKEEDTSVLILSGEPINEPIAARGPFVMNTSRELAEAMNDYRFGQNGF